MDMDARKIKILQAVINDYVDTAEPVGSRTIAKKYNFGVSSATIRNEMADLEEMGYIEQLHSSSGRKPSDKGYRLYVDRLMKETKISPKEEYIIKNYMVNKTLYEMDNIVKEATQLLSKLTKLTCLVKTPSIKRSYINNIQLVAVNKNTILLVIIIDNGIIKNDVINCNNFVDSNMLQKISNLLNEKLKNVSIEKINLEVLNKIKKDLTEYEDVFNEIIPFLYKNLNTEENTEIYFEGTSNILNYPEFKDIEKARGFLSLFDNKEKIKYLLVDNSDISISIGEENSLEAVKECSIVSAVYSIDGRPVGSIGVIGPTRIPYSRVVSILTRVVKEVDNQIRLKNK